VIEEIYNFLPLSDQLLCGGMPSAGQIAELAAAGVRRVINLATFDPEQDPYDEATLVGSVGMRYESIPVDWDAPTPQDLEAFMQVMDANGDEKVFVHCRANYRATAFIALHRILRLGWKPEEALHDVRRIWDPADYPIWEKFIAEQLATDPAS
jgi:protein tyrosine phosphatase (PTP) superfamily phosphohydrolase (DUF442 family)